MAKKARARFDLVQRCRFVFTAIITRMFNKIVNGQVNIFMMVLTTKVANTPCEIFVGLRGKNSKLHPSVVLLSKLRFILARLTDSLQRLCCCCSENIVHEYILLTTLPMEVFHR